MRDNPFCIYQFSFCHLQGNSVLTIKLSVQVMHKHQKYFALSDEDGRLLPYFIAVRDTYPFYLSLAFCWQNRQLFACHIVTWVFLSGGKWRN